MLYSIGMLKSLALPFLDRVHIERLNEYMKQAQAESWHYYAIQKRHLRQHVCIPCKWLKETVDQNGYIFETGCGSAINLIWLGLKGFSSLHGADLSERALKLGQLISYPLGLRLDVWQDDCINPLKNPEKIDGLLAVNWLYHADGLTLDGFFSTYRPFLASGCKVAFDMVDIAYNGMKDNEFHSDDLKLPVEQRRPSEYRMRLSQDEIMLIIKNNGLRLSRFARAYGKIPRTCWLVELTP